MEGNSRTKLCQSCRKCPAVKQVLTDDKRAFRWKCNACLTRKNEPGFTKVKPDAA